MGIREQIGTDLTAAMRAKDALRVETLRLVRAAVLKKEKEKGAKEIDDTVMVQLLQMMANQHRESIEQFEKGLKDVLPFDFLRFVRTPDFGMTDFEGKVGGRSTPGFLR